MSAEPAVRAFYAANPGAGPLARIGVDAARRGVEPSAWWRGTAPVLTERRDLILALGGRTLHARLYRPRREVLPLVVFFHGGGWVMGDLDTHDVPCARLALEADAVVVSVAYRLAPEHPYPAAFEDAYDATTVLARRAHALGFDATRIAVAGDSAGGNLAAAVALAARDRGGPVLAHQVLIYPVVDFDFDRPSYHEDAFPLTRDDMCWFAEQYVPNPAWRNEPYAAPLRAGDLRGVAPATIVTAGVDPLRDEGLAYGRRLHTAGVATSTLHFPTLTHSFVAYAGAVVSAGAATSLICATLRRSLHRERASAIATVRGG
ncbi:MAG: alpha/beta hydrolase [Candidatus Eremiobacteraeota bacterium]|nr:alpha/beta hydrolase [Candidatus Eremiobacteraeota bacterium]